MFYILNKNSLNLLFFITTFMLVFDIHPYSYIVMDESFTFLSEVFIMISWLLSGSLIGRHEIIEVIIDYISSKKKARAYIIITNIFVVIMIIIPLVQIYIDHTLGINPR